MKQSKRQKRLEAKAAQNKAQVFIDEFPQWSELRPIPNSAFDADKQANIIIDEFGQWSSHPHPYKKGKFVKNDDGSISFEEHPYGPWKINYSAPKDCI